MKTITQQLRYFFDRVMVIRHPVSERWTVLLSCLSFITLAATGFIFYLFFERGLHGIFLMLHMVAGAVFAVTLALLVVLRAATYAQAAPGANANKQKFPGILALFSPKNPARQTYIKQLLLDEGQGINRLQRYAAWIFVIAGCFAGLTALSMMFPYFSSQVNQDLLIWHRWVGLVSLLSFLIYVYRRPITQKTG